MFEPFYVTSFRFPLRVTDVTFELTAPMGQNQIAFAFCILGLLYAFIYIMPNGIELLKHLQVFAV